MFGGPECTSWGISWRACSAAGDPAALYRPGESSAAGKPRQLIDQQPRSCVLGIHPVVYSRAGGSAAQQHHRPNLRQVVAGGSILRPTASMAGCSDLNFGRLKPHILMDDTAFPHFHPPFTRRASAGTYVVGVRMNHLLSANSSSNLRSFITRPRKQCLSCCWRLTRCGCLGRLED